MRDEVLAEFRSRLAWNIRHDKKAVLIGLIKLVNAAWIAWLWQIGFPTGLPLILWFVFCVVSLSVAAVLEKAKMARQSTSAGLHDQDVALCTDPASRRDDRPEVITSIGDR
jgi:hypothetical protein